jgi:hypothetical protein
MLAAGTALAWSVLELRQPAPGWFVPSLLALTAAGAATAIGQSGSAKLALLCGGLCGVLGAAAVAAALRLGPATLEGAAPAVALVLAALLLAAAHYSDLPLRAAGLVAAAPVVVLLPRAALGERGRRAWLDLAWLALAAAPLAAAVKLALDASPAWDA